MPPRVKITKEDIVSAAIEIIKNGGTGAFNARNLAKHLGCSTQPIFSNFATMEELRSAVKKKAYALYIEFISEEILWGDYPAYKSYGMAYIRFARVEKELFKLLFMCDRRGEDVSPSADYEASVELIMKANNIDRERAELIHLEVWSATHGIATMFATSFLELDTEVVSRILSDVYNGVRQIHFSGV